MYLFSWSNFQLVRSNDFYLITYAIIDFKLTIKCTLVYEIPLNLS